MNPSGAFASPPNGGSSSGQGYKTMKISQVWSPQCIVMWEEDFRPGTGDWNDGGSYPSTQGLGLAHLLGGLTLALDGSSQFMKTNVFYPMAVKPTVGQSPNYLWWGR